ncbi:MAG: nucleotidyltransferase domain-containing protein [Calditrichaeota bacterium]|nr:nucleotidyltransferase domain-containing protein [Calditrichota bacterium]
MDSTVKHIVDKVVEFIQPSKVILFGSRAAGIAGQKSDYDVVIIYDGALSKREVKVEIHKRLFPPSFALDLFVLTTAELERYKSVANSIAREAVEKGVVVYG